MSINVSYIFLHPLKDHNLVHGVNLREISSKFVCMHGPLFEYGGFLTSLPF